MVHHPIKSLGEELDRKREKLRKVFKLDIKHGVPLIHPKGIYSFWRIILENIKMLKFQANMPLILS